MSEKRNDALRKADELLDRALPRYSGEPLTGLEERVLARVRCEQEAAAARFFNRAKWMRRIAGLAAAAATATAALFIGVHIGQQRSDAIWQQRITSANNSVKPVGSVSVTPAAMETKACATPNVGPAALGRSASAARVHLASAKTNAAPARTARAQFALAAPATRQELALARLAASNPALVSALAQAQQEQRSAVRAGNDESRPEPEPPSEPQAEPQPAPRTDSATSESRPPQY